MTYTDFGFTGTQRGMTDQQQEVIRHFLGLTAVKYINDPSIVFARHGDCIGADDEFHDIVRELGFWIVGHPPTNQSKRAFNIFDQTMEPQEYLVRNKAIVDACEFIFGAPAEYDNVLRSGTWSTLRYAKMKQKPGWIVFPDGGYTELKDWVL